MKDHLIIEFPDPLSVTIKKARAGGLYSVLGTLAFFSVWYGFLFAEPLLELRRLGQLSTVLFSFEGWYALGRAITDENACLWIFIVAPLFGLPQLLRALKISLFGEVLHFNGFAKSIAKDGKPRASFTDVRSVKLRTVVDSDGPDHRVSVVLNDGSSLFIMASDDDERMAILASDIARVLNTRVVKT